MDELDRLFRRLVDNIRAGYPEYLSRPFEVAELYQTLIPYRLNRRELGIETNQEYELLLMRLLAGERGYVSADAALQEAMRKELASPNPDTASFRGFTTNRAALAVEAVRKLEPADAMPDESDSLYAPVPSPAGDASRRFESRSSGPSGAVSRGEMNAPSSIGTATPAFAPRPVPPAPPPRPSAPRAPSPPPRPSAVPMAASPLERAMTSASRPGGHAAHASPGSCRYCSGSLPEGRDVTFCPHCGQNLKIQHCPACSTELEVGWKFCTTCGRNVGVA